MKDNVKLTAKQCENFGKEFITRYLAFGFGSMTKSEIETLVFHLISETESIKEQSNYHIANKLQITESRVKTLRMNAALKYDQAQHGKVLSRIVHRFVDTLRDTEFKEGVVAITLENPVEKRELEHAIKVNGGMIEYGINKEILKISPMALFELIVSVSDTSEKDMKNIVQGQIKNKEKQNEILNKTLTIRQKINKLGNEIQDNAGLASLLLKACGVLF